MAVLSAALRKTSDASSKSMPWIVIEVELRWKLRLNPKEIWVV